MWLTGCGGTQIPARAGCAALAKAEATVILGGAINPPAGSHPFLDLSSGAGPGLARLQAVPGKKDTRAAAQRRQ